MGNAFLKLGKIPGQSTDSKHEAWIDIDSLTQDIHRPMEAGKRGASVGNQAAEFGDIQIAKRLDKSSPLLAEAVADGVNFDNVTIEFVTKVGAKQTETYYQIELEDVRISNHSVHVSSDGIPPSENISLNFRTIKWTYTVYDEKGQSEGPTVATWDVGKSEA